MPGVAHRLHAHRVAGSRQQAQEPAQHAVDARAHQQALGLGRAHEGAQPARACIAVGGAAAKVLVAQVCQQAARVGVDLRAAFGHALQQRRVVGFGRQVHGHLGRRAAAQGHGRCRAAHEAAAARPRVDLAALLGFGQAAGHGGVVQVQRLGQLAQWGQAVARCQAAAGQVLGQQFGDEQVGRLAAVAQALGPVAGEGVRHAGLIASAVPIDWVHACTQVVRDVVCMGPARCCGSLAVAHQVCVGACAGIRSMKSMPPCPCD